MRNCNFHVVLPICLAFVLLSCGSARPYSLEKPQQLESSLPVRVSTPTPLIIEWSSANRGALERRMQKGSVAVQIENGEVRILDDCVVSGKYQYRGFTRKLETHVLTTESELNATFAMGAARLGSTLKQHGKLYVSLSLVGQWENDQEDDDKLLQQAGCAGATHVIQSASVGAFRFYSGDGQRTGAGAALGVTGETGGMRMKTARFFKSDGDFDDCENATSADPISPEGCSALLRLQLRQIGRPYKMPPQAVYDLGEQPFLFSDVVQLNDGPMEVQYKWHRGPNPESLCKQMTSTLRKPVFRPLGEYCRMNRENQAAVLLKKAAGIEKASGEPNREKVGKVTRAQVEEIAKTKMTDLNANDMDAAKMIIKGTARSMGIEVG